MSDEELAVLELAKSDKPLCRYDLSAFVQKYVSEPYKPNPTFRIARQGASEEIKAMKGSAPIFHQIW